MGAARNHSLLVDVCIKRAIRNATVDMQQSVNIIILITQGIGKLCQPFGYVRACVQLKEWMHRRGWVLVEEPRATAQVLVKRNLFRHDTRHSCGSRVERIIVFTWPHIHSGALRLCVTRENRCLTMKSETKPRAVYRRGTKRSVIRQHIEGADG